MEIILSLSVQAVLAELGTMSTVLMGSIHLSPELQQRLVVVVDLLITLVAAALSVFHRIQAVLVVVDVGGQTAVLERPDKVTPVEMELTALAPAPVAAVLVLPVPVRPLKLAAPEVQELPVRIVVRASHMLVAAEALVAKAAAAR
jgi:hypothetical protein